MFYTLANDFDTNNVQVVHTLSCYEFLVCSISVSLLKNRELYHAVQ